MDKQGNGVNNSGVVFVEKMRSTREAMKSACQVAPTPVCEVRESCVPHARARANGLTLFDIVVEAIFIVAWVQAGS